MSNRPKHRFHKEIETLGLKGIPDIQIAKDLGISHHTVNRITTKLWQRRMEQKDEMEKL